MLLHHLQRINISDIFISEILLIMKNMIMQLLLDTERFTKKNKLPNGAFICYCEEMQIKINVF